MNIRILQIAIHNSTHLNKYEMEITAIHPRGTETKIYRYFKTKEELLKEYKKLKSKMLFKWVNIFDL